MKITNPSICCFLLSIILTFCAACNEDEIVVLPPVQDDVLSILPLGDSRVEGLRLEFESYRYELWKNLVARKLAN